VKYRATVGGKDFAIEVLPGVESGTYRVVVNDQEHEADIRPVAAGWLFSLLLDHRSAQIAVEPGVISLDGHRYEIEIERDLGISRAHHAAVETADLKAPIPGLVVAIYVKPGDEVQQGQPLVVLEAMKMQMELKSPRSGHVKEVGTQPGQEVTQSQTLATIAD
jgi:biotin carboxyl carrier protein